MTLEELLKMREELEGITQDILDFTSELYDKLGYLQDALEKCEKKNYELSQAEFEKWIEAGVTIGATIDEISDIDIPCPAKIISVCGYGFIMQDANGKQYTLNSRALKYIDKFKVRRGEE